MPDYGADFDMNRVEEFYPVRKSDLRFSNIDDTTKAWMNSQQDVFSEKFEETKK